MPVLVGPMPGVTETVISVVLPTPTGFGEAAPAPLGEVVAEQALSVEAVLRGVGAPVEKSVLLLLVSVQPPPARIAARGVRQHCCWRGLRTIGGGPVADEVDHVGGGTRPGQGGGASHQRYLTGGAAHGNAAARVRRGKVSGSSRPGRLLNQQVLPWLEGRPMAKLVTDQVEPVAEAYCTDIPETEADVEPALKTSMKSFLYVAPVLPPPP